MASCSTGAKRRRGDDGVQEALSERSAVVSQLKGTEAHDRDHGQRRAEAQFIDDKSGRKPIQSYPLRFALHVMEKRAQQSRQLVSQRLADKGDLVSLASRCSSCS